tara:strand:- start:58997 stop:60625 length:1629 start_codon:yes stop_codon:yes gene_type:complete
MILEVKIAAYIYAHFPNFFRGSKTHKTTINGSTVLGRVTELAKIGSHIVIKGIEEGIIIDSFADISFEMLKLNASSIGGRPDHLKRAMHLITTEVVQKNLPKILQIKTADVNSKSIYWGIQSERIGIPTLSDAQFIFLLNYCKQSISEFKLAIGFDICDSEIINHARPEVTKKFQNIRASLEDYIWGGKSKSCITSIYLNKYGYTPGEVRSIYNTAHKTSMLIIILMTGMRDSEFTHLVDGSLNYYDGLKYLTSKVVKQQHEGVPLKEQWLVIPLVEDAYHVLSYACKNTGNKYLFSSPTGVVRKGGQGYSSLNITFNRLIRSIDKRNLFKDHTFSVHQCRETLAYQLAKQKVGLPFISKQLKHFHSRFNRMPNEVTAGYGEYKKNLQISIQSRMAKAREDVLMDIYGEDKTFAGGGGEIHKNRIDSWFKGAGYFGPDRIKYIQKMANSNISLMPTSIGVCNHNFIEIDDGALPPPCYGDYSCDPECPNHVISEACSSALKDRQQYAIKKAEVEGTETLIWIGLADQLGKHINKLMRESGDE